MSATMNARIQLKRDTTANWDAAQGFIPLAGEIIIYTDYKQTTESINGKEKMIYIPGIKIGDGQAYVQDLPFVGNELKNEIFDHINNSNVHVSAVEKSFWNDKININDASEVVDATLIFNRN